MSNSEEEYIEVMNILRPIIPNADYFGIDNIRHELFLSKNNEINKDSQFYYNKNDFKFIHYTSLNSAESILRSKKLRLYSLNSMLEDDSNEFKSAIKFLDLGLENEEVEEIKKEIFSLSLCEAEVEENEDSLYMWTKYGEEGKGIGLVFSIDPKYYSNWENHMLSKVYYEKENLELFDKALKTYRQFVTHSSRRIRELDNFFYRYYAFYKNKMYHLKKEVRLLYSDRIDKLKLKPKQVTLGRNGNLKNFAELDIEWKLDDDMKKYIMDNKMQSFNIVPIIKLDKIIFGYKLSPKQKSSIAEVFHSLLDSYKERPSFEDSCLS